MDILSLFNALFALFSACMGVFLYLNRKKLFRYIAESTYDYIVEEISSPANQERLKTYMESISQNVVQSVKMALLGQKGGIAKGVSHQMKGLEKDLLSKIVQNQIGIDDGGIVAEYMQKYPILKTIIPYFLKGQQKRLPNLGSSRQIRASGELGKI